MVSLTKKKVSARNRMVFNPFNLPRGCTRVKVCVQQYHTKNNHSSSNFKKEKKYYMEKSESPSSDLLYFPIYNAIHFQGQCFPTFESWLNIGPDLQRMA